MPIELTAADKEVMKTEIALIKQIETFPEIKKAFLAAVAGMPGRFLAFIKKLQNPQTRANAVGDAILIYVRDITLITTRYRLVFLTPFQTLLRRIKQCLDERFMTASEEKQREYSRIYQEIGRIQLEIDIFSNDLNTFADIGQKAVFKNEDSEEYRGREEMLKNLQNDLDDTIMPFAQNVPEKTEIFSQDMEYFITKARELVGI